MTTLFQDDEPKKRRRQKKRDDVWEAMLHVFFPTLERRGIPDGQRSRLNKLVEDFRVLLPQNVHRAAAITMLEKKRAIYQTLPSFRDTSATAEAIAKHWDDLVEVKRVHPGQSPGDAARIQREHEESRRRLAMKQILPGLYAQLDPETVAWEYERYMQENEPVSRKYYGNDPERWAETMVERLNPGAISREIERLKDVKS